MFASLSRSEQIRLGIVGVLALLEGGVMLSIVTHSEFVPGIGIYANLVSLLIVLLPIVIGFLSRRWEAAIVIALLPLIVGALIYLTWFAPEWFADLYTVGVEIERVAGTIALIRLLGFFGWLLRRAVLGAEATGSPK